MTAVVLCVSLTCVIFQSNGKSDILQLLFDSGKEN